MIVSLSDSENEQANDSNSSIEANEENPLDDDPRIKNKTKPTKASKPLSERIESNVDATRKPQEGKMLDILSNHI
jgi:hypothetical protein